MSNNGSGSRADNITTDQDSPKEDVTTLADNEAAMTPDDASSSDDAGQKQPRPGRDEEE